MVGVSDVGVMAIIAVGVRAGNQNCVVVGQCVLDQSGEEEECFKHGHVMFAEFEEAGPLFSVYITQIIHFI